MRGDHPVVRAASLIVSPSISRERYHDRVKVLADLPENPRQ
jgi:hypothetical protein